MKEKTLRTVGFQFELRILSNFIFISYVIFISWLISFFVGEKIKSHFNSLFSYISTFE